VLWNAYLKAKRQTERGAEGKPAAYVIPAEQHDPLTAARMIDKLLAQGVEVQQSASEFTHEGRAYGAGTWVVTMAQPKMGVIRWLLGRTSYPDNTYTRDREGNPIRPYDMSTDNMAEFMGVRVDAVDQPVRATLAKVTGSTLVAGAVAKGRFGYILDGRLNDAFKAVNLLLDGNVDVQRASAATGEAIRAGDFLIGASAPDALVADIARSTSVSFAALDTDASGASRPLTRLRIAMYQRFYGGNMDEGWTRLLLEDFGFPYDTLMDARIKAGNLNRDYDVIILPADGVARMTGEQTGGGAQGGGGPGASPDNTPPEYRSGFGREGVTALEDFVRNGGTLLTFGEAGALPIQRFNLPVRDVVAGLPTTEFWSPGSTLRVNVDNSNALAWGMPSDALATFLAGGQVYEVQATEQSERIERIVTYVDRDILQSGWLLGADVIANKAALLSVRHGSGRVVLIGFRAQHRAQTHGTFKLVFNALVGGGTGQAVSENGR
jgi:hypothetical protein